MEQMRKYTLLKCLVAFALTLILMVSTVWPVSAATIKLNLSKKTLYVGQTCQLKLNNASGTVIWSTSKNTVATVNKKGIVSAVKEGTVTITASNGGKYYRCKITVKNPFLNFTRVNIKVGEKLKLKMTGTTAVSFTSLNESVAIVNSTGEITAKKAGEATIKVKCKNDKTYERKVNVIESKLSPDDETIAKIADAYSKFITQNIANEDDWFYSGSFGLYDITGDGIPEMINSEGTCVLTYCNGEVSIIYYSCLVEIKHFYFDKATSQLVYIFEQNDEEYKYYQYIINELGEYELREEKIVESLPDTVIKIETTHSKDKLDNLKDVLKEYFNN